jgi:hypothetical protein
MTTKKNKGGRPFGSAKIPLDKLKAVVSAYLTECEEKKLVPLVKELAIKLGINDDTISEYREKAGYSAVIKEFDEISEVGWVRYAERTNKPVFPIFMLKSKFKYDDSGKSGINITIQGQGVIALPKNPDTIP